MFNRPLTALPPRSRGASLKRESEEQRTAREARQAEEHAAREARLATERQIRQRMRAEREEAERADRERVAAYQADLPRWEYQVKRVGEEKQNGLLRSQRMGQILNREGAAGWELVAIDEERATFKRQLPPSSSGRH